MATGETWCRECGLFLPCARHWQPGDGAITVVLPLWPGEELLSLDDWVELHCQALEDDNSFLEL